jgi:hypothetical protein
MDLLRSISGDLKHLQAYIQAKPKSDLERLKSTWIDGQDVMLALHVSKRTLQSLRDGGTLPYSRINGKFYYKVADIEKLLDANYTNPKSTESWNYQKK